MRGREDPSLMGYANPVEAMGVRRRRCARTPVSTADHRRLSAGRGDGIRPALRRARRRADSPDRRRHTTTVSENRGRLRLLRLAQGVTGAGNLDAGDVGASSPKSRTCRRHWRARHSRCRERTREAAHADASSWQPHHHGNRHGMPAAAARRAVRSSRRFAGRRHARSGAAASAGRMSVASRPKTRRPLSGAAQR